MHQWRTCARVPGALLLTREHGRRRGRLHGRSGSAENAAVIARIFDEPGRLPGAHNDRSSAAPSTGPTIRLPPIRRIRSGRDPVSIYIA
jgi:hypothetical protein